MKKQGPKIVVVDAGIANTSPQFKDLCHQLGVTVDVRSPFKPCCKGAVERAFERAAKAGGVQAFVAQPGFGKTKNIAR